MNKSQAKFVSLTNIIDTKVNIVVSKSIDRVLDRIDDLNTKLNQRFDNLERSMNQRFNHLENRLTSCFISIEHCMSSIDNSVQSINSTLNQICIKSIEYSFIGIWIACSAVVLCVLSQLFFFIK